jgi:hypothetical protein
MSPGDPIPFGHLNRFFEVDCDCDYCDIHVPRAKHLQWLACSQHAVPLFPYVCTLDPHEGTPVAQRLPQDAQRVLGASDSTQGPWPSLRFTVLDLKFRVLFFSPERCDLDFPRCQVNSRSYLDLAHLMRLLGDTMASDVFLSPENQEKKAGLVYLAAQRQFRIPRHGSHGPTQLKAHILAEFDAAMESLHRAGPSPTNDEFQEFLRRVDALCNSSREFTLQDELTLQEHEDIDRARMFTAMLLVPTPGPSLSPLVLDGYRHSLVCLAAHAAQRRRSS